jgi:hypothetical protein
MSDLHIHFGLVNWESSKLPRGIRSTDDARGGQQPCDGDSTAT